MAVEGSRNPLSPIRERVPAHRDAASRWPQDPLRVLRSFAAGQAAVSVTAATGGSITGSVTGNAGFVNGAFRAGAMSSSRPGVPSLKVRMATAITARNSLVITSPKIGP
jgi:hypothetical protein